MSLSTEYMGLKLKNPIVVAAGPWSRDGASIQRSIDAGASAVVTETITLEANQNPSPRLYLSGSGQLFNTTLFSGIHLEQWEHGATPPASWPTWPARWSGWAPMPWR